MIRRVLTCLAIATWCFLNTWVEFALGRPGYYSRYDRVHTVVVPVVCWEVAITGGCLVAWSLCRRLPRRWRRGAHLLFLALCLVPAGIAAVAVLRALPLHAVPLVRAVYFWPIALAACAALLVLTVLRAEPVSRLVRAIFLYSWPALLVVFAQAARHPVAEYSAAAYRDGAMAAPSANARTDVRFVWIIFDEMSQSVAFDHRPAGLELPNLDRLKAESFYATGAHSQADSTLISMPSLILGEPVAEALPLEPDRLWLRTPKRPDGFAWDSVPNVFDQARQLGFDTALAGWFHPYGRLLNRSLTRCYWVAGWLTSGMEEPTEPHGLSQAMGDRAEWQFAAMPGIGHLPGIFPGVHQRQAMIERFVYLRGRALELAADPSMGLVLLHLPLPHPPGIYDRARQEFSLRGRVGYADNLALVDRTVGMLREKMEAAGLWERTAVLISADHGWRAGNWRGTPEWTPEEETLSHMDTSGVPFTLKLPEQTAGLVYGGAFNTIVTKSLILATLSGRLSDPDAIVRAIEDPDSTRPQAAAIFHRTAR